MIMNKKFATQRYPSIREEVFKYFRQKILKGEALPGSKLTESQLAEEMGISRTPVREALHSLEMEKLIQSVPRLGYVVREITKEDVEEIIEIRLALEPLAAKWCAEKLLPKDIKRLGKIVLLSDRYLERGDALKVVELDGEFHEIIYRASKSQRIEAILQTLRDHMLRFRMIGLRVPEIARRSNEGHRRIVDAIKRKDMRKIESAVRYHLDWTKKDMIRAIR